MSVVSTLKLSQREATVGSSRGPEIRGWSQILIVSLARVYLTLLLSLAAIGTIPVAFGWHASVVQSGSMEPVITPGDVVLTTALPATEPIPLGRVVSFINPAEAESDGTASIRLHRIVSINDDNTFVTQGDANADADSTAVSRGQIVGQARLLVPAIGLPGIWMASNDLVPLLASILVTLVALAAVALDHPRKPSRDSPQSTPSPRET